jgi:DNA topoisomerase-1
MDITRRRTKKGFYYKNMRTCKVIKSRKLLKHIAALNIPPAYEDVRISENPDDKVLAISCDDKDRKQYTYNPRYIEAQQEIKFCDLIHFGRKLKRIRHDIMTHLSTNDKIPSKETVISLVIFIIDRCNFRIGNEKYKKLYDTYGVTTLNSSHIIMHDDYFTIRFIGKKSVENKGKITHPVAIKIMKRLINLYGKFDYIFYYNDSQTKEIYRISEKHVSNYLKKYNPRLVAKMFRTWAANQMVLSELLPSAASKEASLEVALKKTLAAAIKKTAEKMHHTTNVSKKNYVNNEMIDFYLNRNDEFNRLIVSYKKNNGSYPTIDRMLNMMLRKICS